MRSLLATAVTVVMVASGPPAAAAAVSTPSLLDAAFPAHRRLASDVVCSITSGVDFVGNDIGSVAAAAPTDCCAKCSAYTGCKAFAWVNFNGGTCYLKSAKGATLASADVYSGVVASSPAASCPTVDTGVDYIGNDLASVSGSGATDCCTKCSAYTGCKAFSWNDYNGGTCYLKTGKGATVTKTGVVSAVVAASCPTFEQGVDFVGNDLASVAGSGAADCCTKCGARSGCAAFTWSNYNGGTCWLKTAKGTTTFSADVVSAVLGGGSPTPPPTTPAPAPAPATCSLVEEAVDYVGNDITDVAGSGASDCCARCKAQSGCGAFTWSNYNGGTCYLKTGKGATKVSLGLVSAQLDGAPTLPPTSTSTATPRPTTSVPPPTNHVQWRIRSGVIPAKSVNLGGWLVAEYWMSKTSPAWTGVDYNTSMSGEYITMKLLGASRGTAQFEQHRSTWVTEADIQEIAAAGLNTVRVPVGFWIVNDDPSSVANDIARVYAPGSLKYLDKLVNDWAVKYNLAVMVSLHAHQGSQNGNDHSAPQVLGRKDWDSSQANVDSSIRLATFIAARYKNSEAFLGLNLMNEPSVPTSYDVLLAYYVNAYSRIRATGNDCVIAVSPMVEQQGPPVMMDFLVGFKNVWHEWHPYFKWGYEGLNERQIIEAAKGYKASNLDKWTGNPIFLGEWSLGSPEDSAPFKDRTLLKQYAVAQLENYKAATSGWSFWAWRNDQEVETASTGILSGWSMRQLLREGIFTVPA